ncbi:hypothetical protein DESC_780378 [Desulfosarcina cetonica]|nr:hypothetical protein DESC_780378 [Desulfosarcina cetonica]
MGPCIRQTSLAPSPNLSTSNGGAVSLQTDPHRIFPWESEIG